MALFDHIRSKEITNNHLAGACFSTEGIIHELAPYHVGILYPKRPEEILERAKKEYPSKWAIKEGYLRWKA